MYVTNKAHLSLNHAKRKPYVNMVQKCPNLTFTDAKEEEDLPACYQRSIKKPASLMVWGCISAYVIKEL